MSLMNSLSLFLRYARYRYIAYRLLLRIKMGKKKRDEYLLNRGISTISFLPERPYSINGIKAIPRKGTQDYYMLYIPREEDVKPHLIMYENETFVDVGANVGSYSLKIANDYKNKGVKVIAIEAHPGNYKALCRNIEGAEVLALKGATNTLKQLRKIIIEVHGDNCDKVKQILEKYAFKLEIIR